MTIYYTTKSTKIKNSDENFWQECEFIIIYNTFQIGINLEISFYKFCDNLT